MRWQLMIGILGVSLMLGHQGFAKDEAPQAQKNKPNPLNTLHKEICEGMARDFLCRSKRYQKIVRSMCEKWEQEPKVKRCLETSQPPKLVQDLVSATLKGDPKSAEELGKRFLFCANACGPNTTLSQSQDTQNSCQDLCGEFFGEEE